jgi:hypothetical protein
MTDNNNVIARPEAVAIWVMRLLRRELLAMTQEVRLTRFDCNDAEKCKGGLGTTKDTGQMMGIRKKGL